MPNLHIHRIDASLPAARAAQLRGPWQAELDARLPGALAAAGVDPGWAIAVRRLDVDLDGSAAPGVWAEQVAQALTGALMGRRPDEVDEEAAVFMNPIAAGRVALRESARSGAAPWWWLSIAGDSLGRAVAGERGAEALIGHWIQTIPARAAAEALHLLSEEPHLLSRCGPLGGETLRRALQVALRAGRDALAAANVAPGTVPSALHTAEVHRLLGRMSPGVAHTLRRMEPGLARFFCAAIVLVESPGWSDPEALGDTLAQALMAPPSTELRDAAAGSASPPLHYRPAQTTPRAAARPSTLTSALTPAKTSAHTTTTVLSPYAQAADPAEGPSSASEPSKGVPVALGGLLFTLRWFARDVLLSQAKGDVRPLLLQLADALLARVLASLSPARRDAVREEHRLLLGVFCGVAEIGEPQPASPEVEGAVHRLLAALPAGLEPSEDAVAALLGSDGWAALDVELRPLAALLMRAGSLYVDGPYVVLVMDPAQIDPLLRRGGWDFDPGWFVWTGHILSFRYEEAP